MTPKDWNTQEEAIDAAKAEILAAIGDTDARLELGMVKSIQRGYINLNEAVSTRVNISEVNIDKAAVQIIGGGYANSNWPSLFVSDFSPNSFTVSMNYGGQTSVLRVNFFWQVIEYY